MSVKTLTRTDIVAKLMQKHQLSASESQKIIDGILRCISDALVAGECSKFDNFGTFEPREKAERPGRNPKTGERATVSARRVVRFRASKALKKRVHEGNLRSKKNR